MFVGGAVGLHHANDITFAVLALLLQVLTAPVGSNLLARAAYRAEGIPHRVDTDDELSGG